MFNKARGIAVLTAVALCLSCGDDQSTSPGDITAPNAVADLVCIDSIGSYIALRWTAPGDDGAIGTANKYDLRYASAMITDADWEAAVPVIGEPSPRTAGVIETMTVKGLTEGEVYFFALKAEDDARNWSELSSVLRVAVVEDTAVIAPLAVGNRWVYRVTTSGTSNLAASVDYDTITVLRDTTIASERWFVIGSSLDHYENETAWRNRDDGIWFSQPLTSGFYPWLAAKYPTAADETYEVRGLGIEIDVTVEATDRSISVPAGTYATHCYRYDFTDSHSSHVYFALNVGIVRQDIESATGSGSQTISELVSVDLN